MQEAISASLSPIDGVVRVRVNFWRNVVAADVAPGTPLATLLAIADICGIPVRAKKATTNTCSGVVYIVDPSIGNEDFIANVTS